MEKMIVIAPDIEHKGKSKKDTIEYEVHFRRVPAVKVGDTVAKGQFLTDGSADLTELFKYAGKDKDTGLHHLRDREDLRAPGRQHLDPSTLRSSCGRCSVRVKIVEGGASDFSKGDITSEPDLLALNEEIAVQGGEKVTSEGLIMGILDVSLSSRKLPLRGIVPEHDPACSSAPRSTEQSTIWRASKRTSSSAASSRQAPALRDLLKRRW